MKDRNNHLIPDPRDFAHDIAEETRLLRQEISEGITHIYYPLDLRRNDSLKSLSRSSIVCLKKSSG